MVTDISQTEILKRNVTEHLFEATRNNPFIPWHNKEIPSVKKVKEIIETLQTIVFPGYFGDVITNSRTLKYYIDNSIDKLELLLIDQIHKGICFNDERDCVKSIDVANELAYTFMGRIPEIKRLISTDVKATFDADPAATNYGEVIFCYPAIRALLNHCIAHELLKLEIPILPRIISELAHSETGIDIHPGAQIGEYFSIDHGTGVVIGETTIIGNHVLIYQGVTLGAKRFTYDEKGIPLNVPRHPIIEDNVVIYSNANVLGRITIGQNSIIGGNVWITADVPPNSKIVQQKAIESSFIFGSGI